MGKVRLTDAAVKQLARPIGRAESIHYDADLPGFGVRVTATGRHIWIFQYNVGATRRRNIVGDWPNVTAAAARKAAEKLRGASRGGADPVAEGRAAQAAKLAAEAAARTRATADAYTVESLISDWQRMHLASRSPAYRKIGPDRLRKALAAHLKTPADRLDRAAAVKALDGISTSAGPIAANRARAYARACFTWGVKRGTISASPFANLPAAAPERSRDRVLTDDELARVWRASASLAGQWRDLLRVLVLTGQRRSEVSGMTWDEIHGATWTIPAARAKNGAAHDVPLAPPVVEVLTNRPRFATIKWVFSQGRRNAPSGFGHMKRDLDALIREPDAKGKPTRPALPGWTLHDLRRTVATGMQRSGVRLEVTEAVLNHVSGTRSGIVGVYQRHTWTAEKRAALETWATHVDQIST